LGRFVSEACAVGGGSAVEVAGDTVVDQQPPQSGAGAWKPERELGLLPGPSEPAPLPQLLLCGWPSLETAAVAVVVGAVFAVAQEAVKVVVPVVVDSAGVAFSYFAEVAEVVVLLLVVADEVVV